MRGNGMTMRALAALVGGVALVGCQEPGRGPSIEGVDDQIAAVGQELVINLRAEDPDGDDIAFDFSADIEGIHDVAEVTKRPDGTGVFRWTPLADDVGTWYFDFSANDGTKSDIVTVEIEVRTTLGEGAVPMFREPLGSGTTLDLEVSACVEVPIVVEDQDDTEVVLAMEDPGIVGAELVQDSGLSGTWQWCPNKDQIEDDRHPLVLSADDEEHDKTLKNFLIVLRKPNKPDCPGEAPVVEHTPADVATVLDLQIGADISDDIGLKQAPLLYVTNEEPQVPIDFSALDVLEMALESGDMVSGRWTATVPNPVASAAEGTTAQLWYVISAGDNDDSAGDCDHVTDAPMDGTFVMRVTNSGVGGLGVCEPCTADVQCGGPDDYCVALGSEGDAFCMTDCATDDDCDADFSCLPIESVDGTVIKQCTPDSGLCGDPPDPECDDDALEENDSRAQAGAKPELDAGMHDALVSCSEDEDWYEVVLDEDTTIGALVEGGAASNLNLGLYEANGDEIVVAEGASSLEVVEECLGAGTYYLRVYAFGAMDNTYDLLLEKTPGSCGGACVDDSLEPDDAFGDATYAEVYPDPYTATDRMICSGDDDWYEIALYTSETVVVDLTFMQTSGDEDLDLHFHDDGGVDLTPCTEAMPATCTEAQGQGVDSDEHYEFTVAEAGCAPCTYFVRVRGWDGSENDYDLTIALQ